MSIEVTAIMLVAILAFVVALMRASAMREAAWEATHKRPLPTARQRRQWHRDRYDLNPALRSRR